MTDPEIKELVRKYLDGTLTPKEKGLLESWYTHQAASSPDGISDPEVRESLKRIGGRLPLERSAPGKINWPRIAAAIAIVMLAGAGWYFLVRGPDEAHSPEEQLAGDIAPGGNKAMLTLADGKTISLTDAASGRLALQSGVAVEKAADGQLVYQAPAAGNTSGAPAYNTIATPRGGQYQVTLPDGSKVWLNAASSLKYPASFTGLQKRRVELSGEGYFEITKDESKPFLVVSGQQTVEVLGTHFNVNAYRDEPAVKTTLLEGSVLVRTKSQTTANTKLETQNLPAGRQGSKLLRPGQQAIRQGDDFQVLEVDPEAAVGWKNGKFVFEEESLESILRRVSRWYDAEIEFTDERVKKIRFGGTMSRFDNISKVLSKLEITGDVRFEIVPAEDPSLQKVVVRSK